MPKKRLDYLDMAKGVGIFLVVLGHIEYLSESAMRWIYSFHMPLFFVIGGILAYQKEPESPYMLKAQWRRRAKGILIPYASFSIMMLTMRVFELIFQPERITGGEPAGISSLVCGDGFADCVPSRSGGAALFLVWMALCQA